MIEIILLCRNRPEYANEALTSLCNVDYTHLKITISDNSTSPLFINRNFSEEFPHVEINYLYRGPNLSGVNHMTLAARESECDFFCLFHDDDIALPNFISDRVHYFNDPAVIAVGTNAYEMKGNLRKKNLLLKRRRKITRINTSIKLLNEYYSIDKGAVAPFPGYIYRKKSVIHMIQLLESPAGKYSDSVFLAELANHGELVWPPKPTMYYRKHLSNDSNFESLKDRLGLLSLLKKNFNKNSPLIADYRFLLYLIWLPKSTFFKKKKLSFIFYPKKIKQFLFFFAIKNVIRLLSKLINHFK